MLLAAAGCSESTDPDGGMRPSLEGVRLDRIRTWRDGALVRMQGFDDALEPGARWKVEDPRTAWIEDVVGDSRGRFSLSVESSAENLRLGAVELRVRDPEAARARAVGSVVGGAGSIPNDLLVLPDVAVVVRSGDNAVSRFDYGSGLVDGVRLPDAPPMTGRDTVRANPWFAAHIEGARVVVTDTAGGVVHLVDLEAGRVEESFRPPERVALAQPFTLSRPFDVDGDGANETELNAVRPVFPQGLLVRAGWVWAAFSGYLAFRTGPDRPPVFQPAVLVGWPLDGTESPRTLVLPFLNPQWITALDGGRALVACSGVIDPVGARVEALTDGGLVEVDLSAGQIVRSVPLGRTAPGSVLTLEGWWVSSLLRGEVFRVEPSTGEITDRLRLTPIPLDSVFRLVDLGGGLVGAPSFNTDQLFVVDAVTRKLGALGGPLMVGGGGGVLDGLQVVGRRSGRRGVDFEGPELYALLGVAAQVKAIDLSHILGP